MRNLEDSSPGRRLPALKPGLVSLPPSKSHVLRALMIGAASGQKLVMKYELGGGWAEAGDDILRGIDCARSLGAVVSTTGGELVLARGDGPPNPLVLSVGESGFLGRVAPACAALCKPGIWAVQASGSLKGRNSPALWSALMGAGIDVSVGNGWATSLVAPEERGDLHLRGASSSQELSALWIAVAGSGGGFVGVSGKVPSAPYLELSMGVLASFGALVEEAEGGFQVGPVLHGPSDAIDAEVDASAAAVALAAGCISGVRVEVPAPTQGSAQGDWRVVEHLRQFGCVIEEDGGRLVAAKGPQGGAELDLSGEPDLAPALAAVAAHAALISGEGSTLAGLHTLDGKESPRGQVLCSGFNQAGFDCSWSDPVFTLRAAAPTSTPTLLDPHSDHRMAFAFALLGVNNPSVSVTEPDCTAKSWPNFWSSMA